MWKALSSGQITRCKMVHFGVSYSCERMAEALGSNSGSFPEGEG